MANSILSPTGVIARVRNKSDDGRTLHFEVKSGGGGHITSNDGTVLEPCEGDTLLLWPGDNRWEQAPAKLWVESTSEKKEDTIAIVRLKLDDITVISDGVMLRSVPTSSASYDEGNTVAVSPDGRIARVLSHRPLPSLDFGTTNEVDISRFKVDPETITEEFDDFGGMDHVVDRAKRLIEVPLSKSAQLEKIRARPIKGVLFSGPPGTGKTMLARIIARHANAAFYKVSGPEILTKWYGESEAVLRRIFEDAEKQDRAIIFFDEIDTVAASRSGNIHEVSQKLVGQLLTLMDGFLPSRKVIVVAATNRPETLDPALRRPGRFDWEVEFSLPDHAARRAILARSARHLAVGPDLPHDAIAGLTDGWTPAELAVIWSEAALLAADDERERILAEDYCEGQRRVQQQRRQRGTISV